MTRTEKENLVPVWERITISLETSKKLWESRKKFGKAKVRGQSHKIRYRREEAAGYDR